MMMDSIRLCVTKSVIDEWEMKKHFYIILIGAIFVTHCSPNQNKIEKNIQDHFRFKVIAEIGVEGAITKEEEPYQFSHIRSVDCDEDGNIYILDHKDVCVKVFDKSGRFLRKILSSGQGPGEIMNPYRVKVNKFRNSLFVLHEHGFRLKEFDVNGDYINYYSLPEQMVHYFDFLDSSTVVYVAMGKYGEDGYKSIKILDLDSLEIIQEFAPTKRYSLINGYQQFVVDNDILWTCPGDMMELVGFDLKTGDIRRQVPLKVSYTPYQIIRKDLAPGTGYESARIYNFAQPFFIDDLIFIFLTQQEFPEDSTEEIPPPNRRSIKVYCFENSDLVETGDFPDFDFFINIQATWRNRIIVSSSSYDLIPKFIILEVQLD